MNQKTRQLHFHKAKGTFWARKLVLTSKPKQTWHKSQYNGTTGLSFYRTTFFPNPPGWQLKRCAIQKRPSSALITRLAWSGRTRKEGNKHMPVISRKCRSRSESGSRNNVLKAAFCSSLKKNPSMSLTYGNGNIICLMWTYLTYSKICSPWNCKKKKNDVHEPTKHLWRPSFSYIQW